MIDEEVHNCAAGDDRKTARCGEGASMGAVRVIHKRRQHTSHDTFEPSALTTVASFKCTLHGTCERMRRPAERALRRIAYQT